MGLFSGIGKMLSGAVKTVFNPTAVVGAASPWGSLASAALGGLSSYMSKGSVPSAYEQYSAQSRASLEDIPARVAAYRAAGIHPLFGLGGQQWSPSPATIGEETSRMGQAVGSAYQAYQGHKERAYDEQMQGLALERAQLENDLLRSQTTAVQRSTTPALPSPLDNPVIAGQGNAQGVTVNPLDVTASRGGRPHNEAGAINEVGWARTKNGWAPVMSDDVKQRLEEDILGTLGWNLRNRINPEFPPFVAPDGTEWRYSFLDGEFTPARVVPWYKRK